MLSLQRKLNSDVSTRFTGIIAVNKNFMFHLNSVPCLRSQFRSTIVHLVNNRFVESVRGTARAARKGLTELSCDLWPCQIARMLNKYKRYAKVTRSPPLPHS